ncbi:MAG: hypothetical protein C5B50_27345 [Verrucomicrobia bacterium]|nr:MAG: hypothetical protein C5B50_27345 [Verrucomicrobiota bacterium]
MFIPKSSAEKHRRLVVEEALLRERFPFLHSRISGDSLRSRGRIRPTECSPEYRVEVNYRPWDSPAVRILEPKIEPETRLHFYRNGTLCLYDWREQPWETKWHLADTIVPWTAEWLVFYEIYLLTGRWLGKSALHGEATKAAKPLANDDEVKERTE